MIKEISPKTEIHIELEDRYSVADMQIVTVTAKLPCVHGQSLLRTAIIERSDSVAILPYDVQRDQVVLVRQFRAGPYLRSSKTSLLEIIAGYLDPNESADIAVKRELLEETGMIAKDLIPITEYYPAPTISTEKLSLWCGIVDSSEAAAYIENGLECLHIEIIPFSMVKSMLEEGQIADSLTFSALTWLLFMRQSLRDSVN